VELAQLPLQLPDNYLAFNPSIAASPNGGFRMLIRFANYRIDDQMQYVVSDPDRWMRSINYMATLEPDFSIIALDKLSDCTLPGRTMYRYDGYEDCRLFWHDGEWRALGATRAWNEQGICEAVLLTVKDRGFVDPKILSDIQDGHQKNWMPVAGTATGGRFVVIADCAEEGCPVTERFRGGSQLVPFGDGWLCIIHEIALKMNGRRVYDHRFVYFDRGFALSAFSEPFSFTGEDIEFCAGLTYSDERTLIASFGVWDREAWIAKIDGREIEDQLQWVRPGFLAPV